MKMMMKDFDRLFLVIIAILIPMSLLALVAIHWEAWNSYIFSFTPEGINRYLSLLGNYKELFGATVATISAYLGLHRLKAATDANNDKLRQDRFSEWKAVLDTRIKEIEGRNSSMKIEMIRVRYKFFKQLYALNFSISNESQLTGIFQSTFQNLVPFFESQNKTYINYGGIYQDCSLTYTYSDFRYLFLGSIETDTSYQEIDSNLLSLYLQSLEPNRRISAEEYQAAVRSSLARLIS